MMTVREIGELTAEVVGFILVCGSLAIIIIVALLITGSI
jgi:hypothetical protein